MVFGKDCKTRFLRSVSLKNIKKVKLYLMHLNQSGINQEDSQKIFVDQGKEFYSQHFFNYLSLKRKI